MLLPARRARRAVDRRRRSSTCRSDRRLRASSSAGSSRSSSSARSTSTARRPTTTQVAARWSSPSPSPSLGIVARRTLVYQRKRVKADRARGAARTPGTTTTRSPRSSGGPATGGAEFTATSFDHEVIDGAVNGVGALVRAGGRAAAQAADGLRAQLRARHRASAPSLLLGLVRRREGSSDGCTLVPAS